MILEIMQPDYLRRSANVMKALLSGEADSAARGTDTELKQMLDEQQVDPADLKFAAEEVARGVEFLQSSGEAGEPTIFPRDQAASHIQSILQRYFLARNLVQHPASAGAGETVHPISDLSLDPSVAALAPRKLFGAMSQTDARWVACLAAQVYRKFRRRRQFPDSPADPANIANNARIYLLADWGSGVQRAKKIADRIRTMMRQTDREQHVIHLGDVYYSGWPEEYDDHFLPNWPIAPGQGDRYGSWCLNANHDMFSGGHGYFDHLLKDDRFRRQRSAGRPVSYFSLENDHWQILGLDSAWQDGDLAGRQLEWVEQRRNTNPNKLLILMTHHQPFSAFEKDYVKLQPLLKNKPTAWFWGHEHRFAMYKPRPDLERGRLIGHAGVPVWAHSWKPVPAEVEYVGARSFASGLEKFALFGFAVLDFNDDHISARYIDEYGTEERTETI